MEPPKNGVSPEQAKSTNNQALAEQAVSAETKEIKKKSHRRIMVWIIIILLLLLALFLLIIWLFPKPTIYGDTINVNQPAGTINTSQNIMLATTTAAAKRGKPVAESENFEMLQINLEGSGTNVFDFGETEIFTLSNIASQLYSTKAAERTEIRAVISCQTNKRSYVEVEYFKSGEQDKKVFKDSYLGFSHILVIPALDPDSVYRYSISATDLNQTKIYSEQYVFYTGAGNISLVDVLGNAVQKVFGWALGR